MQFKYSDTWGPVRGSTNYTQYDVQLNNGEYIEKIKGNAGWLLGSMHLLSTAGRDLGLYGGTHVSMVENYGDPDKSIFTFLEGRFCLHYDYGDNKDRFCDIKISYLYSN